MYFDMSGSVVPWQCIYNPIENTSLEWVSSFPPHWKVNRWPGDPIKNPGVTQQFTETESYELKQVPGGTIFVVTLTNDDMPNVKLLVPALDMRNLVNDALTAAMPSIPSLYVPQFSIDGAQFNDGVIQVWGHQ
jgi:hypothetical protein